MLDTFILENRDVIIARIRTRVAARPYPSLSDVELTNGIPIFLDQVVKALRVARRSNVADHEHIGKSAGQHGEDLFRIGLTVAQVVHDYGAVCQTITELAAELAAPIAAGEFQTLNLCLDDAIAEAVTEYSRHRELSIEEKGTERLGILAHELRNLLSIAMLAFDSIKSGRVSVGGSTALVHERSLIGLRDLIDRSLADVRLDAGIGGLERIPVAELIEEVEIGARLQAGARGINLAVTYVDRTVTIEGDRQILAAALTNLLQNAFKFTRDHSHVSLTTRSTPDRVCFDVEDECGGLPPGKTEDLFRSFAQQSSDRSGLGLGLTICHKAAEANAGVIHVRDIPGKGCVFTLDLPRKPPPPLTLVGDEKRGKNSSDVVPRTDPTEVAAPKTRATR